jgi:hypothetical protein
MPSIPCGFGLLPKWRSGLSPRLPDVLTFQCLPTRHQVEPEQGILWDLPYFLITLPDGFRFVSIVKVAQRIGRFQRQQRGLKSSDRI